MAAVTGSDRLAEIRRLRQEQPAAYEADRKLQAEELDRIEAEMRGRGGGGRGGG